MTLEPPHLVLYTAPGCCLCDEMKSLLGTLRRERDFSLEVVDISGSAALEEQFRSEIPVLFVNDRKVAKYRITEEVLRRALDAPR